MIDEIRYEHLLYRPFIHGKQDCYTLAQDIYRDNLGLELTNYARPDDWWLDPELDLYKENFRKEGFQLIDDIDLKAVRLLDAFLIGIPDSRNHKRVATNHCAIYVGNGMVIHHPFNGLSTLSPYRGALRHFTTHIIRHKDCPHILPRQNKGDIMDYLLPHKRRLVEDVIRHKENKDRPPEAV